MDTYRRLCTEYYDLSKPQAPPDAVEFYLRLFHQGQGPVLEPMCGSGRFLLPFLERGIDIDGVDGSPQMLDACHRHCRDKGLEVTLYQQLVEELDLPRGYGFIMIPAGSFGLIIDRAAATEALRRLHRHLLLGGHLVLEIETLFAVPPNLGKWRQGRLARPDGSELVFNALPGYDKADQVQHDTHRYEVVRDGVAVDSEIEYLSIRFYRPDEFRRMLTDTGFTNIRISAASRDLPPGDEDATVVFHCQKPWDDRWIGGQVDGPKATSSSPLGILLETD